MFNTIHCDNTEVFLPLKITLNRMKITKKKNQFTSEDEINFVKLITFAICETMMNNNNYYWL